MSILNLQASFFAFENPFRVLERRLHKFQYRQTVRLGKREVEVNWTRRAGRELQQRQQPLIVELQLYFSCVVKKRVLFHDHADFETVPVNSDIELAFRPIASAACNPEEFAAHYPAGKDLSRGAAARMIPRSVEIDYRRGHWEGQFTY